MKVNVYSCLLLSVLGCNISTAIKHVIVQEKQSVALPCPHSVGGEVTWSRETNGHRVDILTADGDRDKKHIPDPGGRYNSQADKSLHISRVIISDSGTYLCNNEAAVELTVIPSGTTRRSVKVTTSVVLKCLSDPTGSHVPTWTRQKSGTNITVYSQNIETQHMTHFIYSTDKKTLTITRVQRVDAGQYYCDGKPVVYLDVMEDEGQAAVLVRAVLVLLLLLIMVIIIFVTWRCSIKRRGGRGEQTDEVVNAETSDIPVFESAQATPRPNETVYSQVN
ncbi:roundabout homolog 3-like [Sparus aurata]|uniref:roundabout homolog 3-like n=1 Tax=Sparus aurata TaxID=8175 RepID=UPI0011C17087|nr:roundabout homolog 3-like [Sparus aurata]